MATARHDPDSHPAGPVDAHFKTAEQQRWAALAGMWLFLGTEVLFFGGLFLGFTVYRLHYPATFAVAAGELNLTLGTLNTAILLTSGLLMAATDPAMAAGRRRRALWLMGGTVLLGCLFLGIKGVEYAEEIHKGLAPFFDWPFLFDHPQPEQGRLFFSFYFALTGLHALHMAIGLGLILVMLGLTWRWKEPSRLERRVRITGLYWAFVDMVWVFVYPTLYLLRG